MGSSCDDCVNYLAEIRALEEKVDKLSSELEAASEKINDVHDIAYDLYKLVR